MKLGMVADQIRVKGAYKDHKEDLIQIGFDFEKQDDWLFVKNALLSYSNMHGSFQVPTSYRFPLKSDALVEELWGYPIGKTVTGIRKSKKYEKYHDELRDMGFDMKKKKQTQRLLALITIFIGNIKYGYSGDKLANNALLSFLWGVAVDSAYKLYIADTSDNLIRMIDGIDISNAKSIS